MGVGVYNHYLGCEWWWGRGGGGGKSVKFLGVREFENYK